MANRGMFSKDLYERISSDIQDFRMRNK